MKIDHNMHEKIFLGGNILGTAVATVGSVLQDFWPVAIGIGGMIFNAWLKWRKEQQEYRHREELHQIEKQNRQSND